MKLCFIMRLRGQRVEIEADWDGEIAEVTRITDCATLDVYDWTFTEFEEYNFQECAASEASCAATMPDPDDLPTPYEDSYNDEK